MTALDEVLEPVCDPVRVDDPLDAKLISVRLHGKGAVRRVPGEGKAPKAFTGNRGRAGQFVFSRIWARRGAMALIPADLDGVVVTNEFPIFDINRERLDPNFLNYFVQTDRFIADLERVSAGASGQNRVKESAFLGLDIPLPSLVEQRRIAAILDHADALRARRRQVFAHLDSLTKSIFNAMFNASDYPSVRLDSLTDGDDRINYGVVQPGDALQHGIPLIRVSDLKSGKVDRTSLKLISPDIESRYVRSRINGTEVLVGCVGSIGAVSVVSDMEVGHNIARAVTRVPISDPVTRHFVAAYLRTPGPQRYFVAELRTVAQATLNVGQLKATPIPIPPHAIQQAIVEALEAVDALRRRAQQFADAERSLFASLQSRAFSGQL